MKILRPTNLFVMALFMVVGCSDYKADEALMAKRQQVEDSIGSEHMAYALGEIDRQMQAANDSDTYYLWLSSRMKAYYTGMQTDSLRSALTRIGGYLTRNSKNNTYRCTRLRADWMLAKGVWQTAICGRPDSGQVYNEQAIRLLRGEEQRPSEQLLTALCNRADYYRQMGKLDYSADAYVQAMALADSMPQNARARIVVELGIATVYSFMADYANGNRWWKRAEQDVKWMNRSDRFIFYNNRGNDLYFQKRYREAQPYFQRAVNLVKGDSLKQWDYYTALANLGENDVCLHRLQQARQSLDEADAFFDRVGFDIGKYYVATSRIQLAMMEQRDDDALRLIGQSATPPHMIPLAVVHRLKTEERVYRQLGHYEQAYRARQRHDALSDSIQQSNQKMCMNARLLQYRHDQQMAERQHVIDRQYIMGLLSWGLFLVALLTVMVLAIMLYLRRRQQQLREMTMRQQIVRLRLENIRNRISPHFIFNALSLEMVAQNSGKEVNLNALVQLLRRGLSQADVLETTLGKEMEFVNYYVEVEGRQLGDDFSYETRVAPDVSLNRVFLPAMVVQIFVENAIKHGLREAPRQEGCKRRLRVSVKRKGANATAIEVTDNGIGLRPANTSKVQTGMRVVRQTVQMLNEYNTEQISFGLNNYTDPDDGQTGCLSWMVVPDNYDFSVGNNLFK